MSPGVGDAAKDTAWPNILFFAAKSAAAQKTEPRLKKEATSPLWIVNDAYSLFSDPLPAKDLLQVVVRGRGCKFPAKVMREQSRPIRFFCSRHHTPPPNVLAAVSFKKVHDNCRYEGWWEHPLQRKRQCNGI
jgi:hypothetical protein